MVTEILSEELNWSREDIYYIFYFNKHEEDDMSTKEFNQKMEIRQNFVHQ